MWMIIVFLLIERFIWLSTVLQIYGLTKLMTLFLWSQRGSLPSTWNRMMTTLNSCLFLFVTHLKLYRKIFNFKAMSFLCQLISNVWVLYLMITWHLKSKLTVFALLAITSLGALSQQVNSVCSSCNYQLRRICSFRFQNRCYWCSS